MTQYRCTDCGVPLPNKYGRCQECRDLKKKKERDKMINRQIEKTHNTLEWSIGEVRKYAEGQFWSSSHKNCFRASIGKAESEAHVRCKFEQWLHHRKLGRTVFCELRLKNGLGRPDLIILDKGHIWVIEVVCSEKEASLIKKQAKYPWDIKIVYANKVK